MPLARHDFPYPAPADEKLEFLLTCLLRGMTYGKKWTLCHMGVSTHMPLARHDAGRFIGYFHHGKFLLTCLLRGMTDILYFNEEWHGFYSHASCEA